MVTTRAPIVVIGAGHAGVQVAVALRDNGYDDPIVLISDEKQQPYHRPPLSKTFVTAADPELQPLCGQNYYNTHAIDLLTGVAVTAVDPGRRCVHLASGTTIEFEHLVLATGSRSRALPTPGADLDGVLTLRTAQEAVELRERLASAERIVVIGGGFIAMEFAAAAALKGGDVAMLEAAPRVMARSVTPGVSDCLQDNQNRCGVRVRTSTVVSAIQGSMGRGATEVLTASGGRYPADLVVAAVGARPNIELAVEAGLTVSYNGYEGVLVDEFLTTSHPDISAIGDCARFPSDNGHIRLESVQNAVDQARFVAERLVFGRKSPYRRVPWFWSDQGHAKLQIAGLTSEADTTVLRGDRECGRYSVFGFSRGRLVCVESINKPGDHLAARRILGADINLTEAEAADTALSLKSYVLRANPAAQNVVNN
jgi:3-phenylpropionate/trans-cinnamate dioxygenase ferredoxin reductase subunit